MARASTSYKKNQSGNPNGRPKGVPNKVTATVREAFATAFSDLQEDPAHCLAAWARMNPTEFYKLAAKLIPLQITGEGGKPIEANITWLGNIHDKQSEREAEGGA